MLEFIINELKTIDLGDIIDLIELFFPIIVSVLVYLSHIKIIDEVDKNKALKFSDSFGSIEYDITEILQLCIIKAKNINMNNMGDINGIFPFYIPNNRDVNSNMPPTDNAQERIYRLCGYICSYGSEKAIKLFCELQNEYAKGCNINNINRIVAILALLVTQLKYDSSKVRISYEKWINIRLPIYSKSDKEEIFKECKRIKNSIKSDNKKK